MLIIHSCLWYYLLFTLHQHLEIGRPIYSFILGCIDVSKPSQQIVFIFQLYMMN